MEENEKKELITEIQNNLSSQFENLETSILGLQEKIEKEKPPKAETKLEDEQNELNIGEMSKTLKSMSEILTELKNSFFDSKPNEKKKSFLSMLLGGE